jgi:hypothetical protein
MAEDMVPRLPLGTDELCIQINTDPSGKKVYLNRMTPKTAESLISLIRSLTALAKTYEDEEVTISVRGGSIIASMPTPNVDVRQDILNMVHGTSTELNKGKVKILKEIQQRIRANGFGYSVFFDSAIPEQKVDLTEMFKGKDFVVRRARREWNEEILFLKGNLYEAGGKSTVNIHLDSNGKSYTVQCTKDEAKRFNEHLYGEVYISVLRKSSKGATDVHTLVDTYYNDSSYLNYLTLYREVTSSKDLERFDRLHDKIRDDFNAKRYLEIMKLMRLFNHADANRGLLRSLLMSIRPIHTAHDGIKDLYNSLLVLLRDNSIVHRP